MQLNRMIDFKKELNQAQHKVVTEASGPSLVLAGAGSGKTRTLVYRVAYLIEQGVKPERILLLTFTNKAAHEMLSRVDELLKDPKQTKKIWGGTFHHVANRLLRKMGKAIGLKSNFSILDREDSKDMLKRCIKQIAGGTKGKRLPQPGIFLEVVSYAVNAQITIEEALSRKYPEGMRILELFEKVGQLYVEKKKKANALDFDDLLLYWLRLLQLPLIKAKLADLWEYILVDEYQDTNVVQDSIVRLLASKHKNILVVGDDAQSIYSFRAADIKNILDFPKQFKGTKIFKLEENYRSSPEILDVANAVIERNTEQFKKTLFTGQESFVKPELLIAQDPSEEATHVADRIMALEDEGVKLDSIAILFRAAHNSQALELELNKRGIPYEMRGGLRFFERAHIKDILAYVRVLSNVHDEVSWHRVLAMYEGIGEVTAQKIIAEVMTLPSLDRISSHSMPLGAAASKGWASLQKTIAFIKERSKDAPGELIRALRRAYTSYAELQFTDFKDRLEDLEQLALFADSYDALEPFVTDTSLQEAHALRPQAHSNEERGVILSTIHQAKGLEWNTVFLIQLTGSSLPHPRAMLEEGGLEEERRLFYVALTRAQRRIYLFYPLSSSRFSISLHQPSQFLKEINPELITGKLEIGDDEGYINVDDDGERGFLPSIDRL